MSTVPDQLNETKFVDAVVDLVNKLRKSTVESIHTEGQQEDSFYLVKLSGATKAAIDLLAIKLNIEGDGVVTDTIVPSQQAPPPRPMSPRQRRGCRYIAATPRAVAGPSNRRKG